MTGVTAAGRSGVAPEPEPEAAADGSRRSSCADVREDYQLWLRPEVVIDPLAALPPG